MTRIAGHISEMEMTICGNDQVLLVIFYGNFSSGSGNVNARKRFENILLGPVRTTRNFVCFAKKSVNAKPFVVRTIFVTHQNFRKCHQTSNTPSTSFGGLQFFVRRANVLFLDRYPSTGHHIS